MGSKGGDSVPTDEETLLALTMEKAKLDMDRKVARTQFTKWLNLCEEELRQKNFVKGTCTLKSLVYKLSILENIDSQFHQALFENEKKTYF